jgi:hypothetical protein
LVELEQEQPQQEQQLVVQLSAVVVVVVVAELVVHHVIFHDQLVADPRQVVAAELHQVVEHLDQHVLYLYFYLLLVQSSLLMDSRSGKLSDE